MYYNLTMLRRTLVRLLRLEDPLGEHHQQVDGAHHEDAAPEPNHADNDGLKEGTLVIAGEAHSQCNSNVKYIYTSNKRQKYFLGRHQIFHSALLIGATRLS